MTTEDIRWADTKPGPVRRPSCTICGRRMRDFDTGDQCRSCTIASMGTAPEPREPKKRGTVGDWVSGIIDVLGEAFGWLLP